MIKKILQEILDNQKSLIEGQQKIIEALKKPKPDPTPQICQKCKGTGTGRVGSGQHHWLHANCESCNGSGAIVVKQP